MRPVHPGEVLKDELLEMEMSARAFAAALDVPTNRITGILNGKRAVSADSALRLSRFFGSGPEIWMNLQTAYDLAVARRDVGKAISKSVRPRARKPKPKGGTPGARAA